MKYIGARYMPEFMGLYDATTSYEALSVVDNGMGTSYVSNKPTPAGTPLTDTNYWAIYGASSGAIINLQNQIDQMEFVTPERYGAVGDGLTDDSQAIYDALNSGKAVALKKDTTYYLDYTLVINTDIVIYGNGATLLFNARTSNQIGGIAGDEGPSMRIQSGSIKCYNVKFKHKNGSASHTNQCVVIDAPSVFDGCTFDNISSCALYIKAGNAKVNDCHFIDCGFYGSGNFMASIYASGPIKNVIVSDCLFDDSPTTIKFRGGNVGDNDYLEDSIIRGCTFNINSNFASMGVGGIGCQMVHNIVITENTFNGIAGANASNLIDIHKGNRVVVSDNILIQGSDGVFVGDETTEDIIICNNLMNGNVKGVRVVASVTGAVEDRINIENNIFINQTSDGIEIVTTGGTQCRFITINSCEFWYMDKAITIDGANQIKITDCRFYRPNNYSISIDNSSFIFINDCDIQDGSKNNTNNMIEVDNTNHVRIGQNEFLGLGLGCVGLLSSGVTSCDLIDNLYRSVTTWLNSNASIAIVETNNRSW